MDACTVSTLWWCASRQKYIQSCAIPNNMPGRRPLCKQSMNSFKKLGEYPVGYLASCNLVVFKLWHLSELYKALLNDQSLGQSPKILIQKIFGGI